MAYFNDRTGEQITPKEIKKLAKERGITLNHAYKRLARRHPDQIDPKRSAAARRGWEGRRAGRCPRCGAPPATGTTLKEKVSKLDEKRQKKIRARAEHIMYKKRGS